MSKTTGQIKWFDPKKGYGFIVSPQSEKDVFLHYSQLQQDGVTSCEEGDKVEFDLVQTDAGIQAKNVVIKVYS